MKLPRGEHTVTIFSHNPVGWSENPSKRMFLSVVSGAPSLQGSSMLVMTLLLGLASGIGNVVVCYGLDFGIPAFRQRARR